MATDALIHDTLRIDQRSPGRLRPVPARTYVVGYDGSPEARAAFELAADRAGAADKIVVVHAIDATPTWLGDPNADEAIIRNQRFGRAVLDGLRALADEAPATVEFEMLEGTPADVLLRVAATRDAHEIIVGSRGLGRVRSALLSVSRQVMEDADRPVIVIRRAAA